ncbi:protein of unknown function [Pseudomonas mediterranea]
MARNQLLGHRQFELAVHGLQANQLRQQVAHHAVSGVFQRQGFDLVDPLVQAHAELAEQGKGQPAVALQESHVGGVGEAIQLGRADGIGGRDVVGRVHQHHGFGERLALTNHLEHLLLTVRGQAIDFHGSGNHEVKRLRRLPLAKQRVALVDVQQLAGTHQFVELFVIERFEQMMTAQNLVMDAVEHHGVDPCDNGEIDWGQTRFRDRPLASATTQESRRNQMSGRATCFMGVLGKRVMPCLSKSRAMLAGLVFRRFPLTRVKTTSA